MKHACAVLIFFLYVVSCTSCSAAELDLLKEEADSNIGENISNGDTYMYTVGKDPIERMDELQLPCYVDLESDEEASVYCSVQNTKEWESWDVVMVNGEPALKKVLIHSELPEEIPATGGKAPPTLRIGSSSWSDYSVSFDFYLDPSEDSRIRFVLYDESNIYREDDNSFLGDQFFWFELRSDGGIYFNTTFFTYFSRLTDDTGKFIQIDNLYTDAWNTITLKNENNNLILIVNSLRIGAIYKLNGSEYGRFALDGSFGCMFKNIYIT